MFQSLHALGDLLQRQRTEIESTLGHRAMGVAACEVLDELAAVIATVTDKVPAAAPITRTGIMQYGDRAIAAMKLAQNVFDKLDEILKQGGADVYQRRQPQIRLIDRIESEGYAVDSSDFTTVSDAKVYAAPDNCDAAARIQLDAEKITRAEQARVYQDRLQRVEFSIERAEAEYAQQIRQLITAFG